MPKNSLINLEKLQKSKLHVGDNSFSSKKKDKYFQKLLFLVVQERAGKYKSTAQVYHMLVYVLVYLVKHATLWERPHNF